MRRSPMLLSFTVAGSLICAPVMFPAPAQAAPPALFATGEEDPAIAEARTLYKDGEVKFETADYEDALALWKKAYAILPDGEDTRGMRHALVYNIAEAHSRAYEVSRNPAHLRKAKILLETYRSQHRELYGDEGEAVKERTEVDDRIAELDKLIAESESAGETASPLAEPGDTTEQGEPESQMPAPTPKPLTPKQQWEADVKADPQLGPMWQQGQKRVVGGAVLTGIGGFFLLLSIPVFMGTTTADFFPGLWIGGGAFLGVVGLGTLIPGAVLLAKGTKQRKEVLKLKPRPVSLAPTLMPGGGGVSFALRF